MLNHEEQLILQELISISFVAELCNNQFLESDFFDKMNFGNPSIKELIKKIKIDNQGMLVIFLYALLLTPKEKIYNQYKNDYDLLDNKIDSMKLKANTTYTDDSKKIKYVRHMRNAIGHGKVEYTENSVIFKDNQTNTGETFEVEILLEKISLLLEELQRILYKYIADLKSRLS